MRELRGKIVELRPTLDADATQKIGDSLRQMRELSGLTQAEMAQRLEIGQAAVSKVEKGRAEMHVSTIQKYVEALGGTLMISAAFDAEGPLCLHIKDSFNLDFDGNDQLILPLFPAESIPSCRDMIISIRPKYVRKILSGQKTVELRRRFPEATPRGTVAYIYSTSPERALVGAVDIAAVERLSLKEIWHRYERVAFIERMDFDAYFDGLSEGFAVELKNVRLFKHSISLVSLRERFGFEPPQSFLYAKPDLKRALKNEHTVLSY